jgi:lysophospholipase L1-like esterase
LADEYNSGDYLHPNEKGYEKMAAAFDPEALKRFANGVDG